MLFIGFRIGVTSDTSEYGIIIRVGVTIIAIIPFTLMLSTIDREVFDIVIESSWFPCVFTMTGCAVGSKS